MLADFSGEADVGFDDEPDTAALSLVAQWAAGFDISKLCFVLVLLANTALIILCLRRMQPEWMRFLGNNAMVRTA